MCSAADQAKNSEQRVYACERTVDGVLCLQTKSEPLFSTGLRMQARNLREPMLHHRETAGLCTFVFACKLEQSCCCVVLGTREFITRRTLSHRVCVNRHLSSLPKTQTATKYELLSSDGEQKQSNSCSI